MSEIVLEGLDRVLGNLSRLGIGIGLAAGGTLYREGERIMTESKQSYVPVDTGTLRNSGHVANPAITHDGAEVVMGFGGPAEAYAFAVHEDLTSHHSHGSAKYLERPLQEAERTMDGRLAADLEKQIEELIR